MTCTLTSFAANLTCYNLTAAAQYYPNTPVTWKAQLAMTGGGANKWWSVDHLGTVRHGRLGTSGSGTTAKRRLGLEESGKKILEKLKKGYLPDHLIIDDAYILTSQVLRLLVNQRRINITPTSERGDWLDQVRVASFGNAQDGSLVKNTPFPWVVLSDVDGKMLTSCSLYDLGVNFTPAAPLRAS